MKVKSIERELELLPKTRKMTRQINEVLFSWVDIWVNSVNQKDMDLQIPMMNIEKSNELSIKLMYWLSDEEIDFLSDEEFTNLLENITKKK